MSALLGVLAGCGGPITASEAQRRALTGRAQGAACPPPSADGPGRELRGIWVTTVRNIDWPPKPGLSPDKQRAAYRTLLDAAAKRNVNAVFVQVRPTADAFHPSPHEPWSRWLTGQQGRDPGYDPMRFMIDEAHARGMQFHAWFNPYRIGDAADRGTLHAEHPARKNPGWVRRYGRHLWYDPGLPQVRDLATRSVLDVVGKYDVDGVHFDDYFYPYPEPGRTFDDDDTYARYGRGAGSRADWRRDNVNSLVRDLSRRIHDDKPWVRFGISPFGVWRNARTDKAGSPTSALQSYDDIYADTRKWMTEGWVDYVAPQLYWQIGFGPAGYRELSEWWATLAARTKVQLYTGQAAYRVGEPQWKDPDELSRHVRIDRGHEAIRGQIYFSAKNYIGNTRGFTDRLVKDHYATPALVPALPGRAAPPRPVTAVEAAADGPKPRVRLRWPASGAGWYAVYRLDGRAAACSVKAEHLVATRPGDLAGGGTGKGKEHTFTDSSPRPGHTYTYVVTALDRHYVQSRPSGGATVTLPKG
jgi:uncharacterized lipoprotein YddW (UPF0748 family)